MNMVYARNLHNVICQVYFSFKNTICRKKEQCKDLIFLKCILSFPKGKGTKDRNPRLATCSVHGTHKHSPHIRCALSCGKDLENEESLSQASGRTGFRGREKTCGGTGKCQSRSRSSAFGENTVQEYSQRSEHVSHV